MNLDPVAISATTPTDPMIIARECGGVDGTSAAVQFLFAGKVDDDAIIVLDRMIRNGNQSVIDSLPRPQDDVRPYPPNAIAISERAKVGALESPYSWYLELCDVYDEAFRAGIVEHIRAIARAAVIARRTRNGD